MAVQKDKKWTVESGQYNGPGTQVEEDGITFSFVTEQCEKVELLIYQGMTDKLLASVPMELQPWRGTVRCKKVSGLKPEQITYNYLVDGKEVVDPAARVVLGRPVFGDPKVPGPHQVRGSFIKKGFDWKDDRLLSIPYEDVTAYYLHVRGFTKNRRSGVSHKGTFRGIIEKIPYLTDLGVNQLILMPAYEFNEIMREEAPKAGPFRNMAPNGQDPEAVPAEDKWKLNYWGYTTSNYYAPKCSYSAGSKPDVEFKEMVRALHQAGIEVIMEFAFPDDYGLGFIERCLSWWAVEYHVDGFSMLTRTDYIQALARYPLLKRIKLMGPFFDISGKDRLAFPQRFLADYNDGFKTDCRKMLKGDEGMLGGFVDRMKANDDQKAVMNYITGHDGFTLMDLVSYDSKHNEENGEQNQDGPQTDYSWNCGVEGPTRKKAILALRLRQMKNAMSMLLLAQGTPVLLAGDEFGNSQKGNNNPYCIDSELTWVDWQHKSDKLGAELYEFTKQLIAFRKTHQVFHLNRRLTGSDEISCGYPDFSCHAEHAWYGDYTFQSRHIGLMYCRMDGQNREFVYIAYNFHWDPQSFALPYLPTGMNWKIVMDTSGGEIAGSGKETAEEQVRQVTVPGRCICVLEGR